MLALAFFSLQLNCSLPTHQAETAGAGSTNTLTHGAHTHTHTPAHFPVEACAGELHYGSPVSLAEIRFMSLKCGCMYFKRVSLAVFA